jgi:hypothetical protein
MTSQSQLAEESPCSEGCSAAKGLASQTRDDAKKLRPWAGSRNVVRCLPSYYVIWFFYEYILSYYKLLLSDFHGESWGSREDLIWSNKFSPPDAWGTFGSILRATSLTCARKVGKFLRTEPLSRHFWEMAPERKAQQILLRGGFVCSWWFWIINWLEAGEETLFFFRNGTHRALCYGGFNGAKTSKSVDFEDFPQLLEKFC